MKAISVRRPNRAAAGFTLIELLLVMAIIAALAALTFGILKPANKLEKLDVARAEMKRIESALADYHGLYNTYPPGNPTNSAVSGLYYELTGVNHIGTNYQTLDGASSVGINGYAATFNTGGVINSTKPPGGSENRPPQNFLLNLKPNQVGTYTSQNVAYNLLVTSVGGPDDGYLSTLAAQGFAGNPFNYAFPGTNNPNTYDLWIDLKIAGKIYLICNWDDKPHALN